MSTQKPDTQEDKPLDPVMENVRRKMVRLQLVSAGVMLVMLMVVLGAIVYKLRQTDSGKPDASAAITVPSDAPQTAKVALPADFTVSNVALSGGQILFYGSLPGEAHKAIVFDIAAGRIVAEVHVTSQ